jgi:hypothetical protein
MKKSRKILVALAGVAIAVMAVAVDVLDEDHVIPADNLPLAAKSYVQDNFPGGTIAYAKKKNDLYRTSYEVKLNNGFELEFDKNGCVTDFEDPDFDD